MKFIMCVDDSSFFSTGDNEDHLFDIAILTLSELSKWSKCDCLKIKYKTNVILSFPKDKILNVRKSLVWDGFPFELLGGFKTLGVYFLENMVCNALVRYIKTKLSQVIRLTFCHHFVLPSTIKLLIHNSIFFSRLCYRYLIWGATISTNIQQMHILQKKDASVCTHCANWLFLETTFLTLRYCTYTKSIRLLTIW